MKHYYGLNFSPRDDRDNLYTLQFTPVPIPPSVDLRPYCSAVSDQLNLGACGGFTIAEGLGEFLRIKESKKVELSALWVYQKVLLMTYSFGVDRGITLRDGMKVASKQGIALDSDWPYDISKFKVRPPVEVDQRALNNKLTTYHRLYTLKDIKYSISEGYGCAIGFMVRRSFESIKSDGKMKMPSFWEARLGGHAVFVVGYKDDPSWKGGGYLIIKNSWGTYWGDVGYFYMPYAYVNPINVPEIWTGRM
jgi:C1A family cysteine protease